MTTPLIDQPTAWPTRKLVAGGGASAILTPLIVWGAGALGIPIPIEAATGLATVLFAAFGYFTKDRAHPLKPGRVIHNPDPHPDVAQLAKRPDLPPR